MLTVEVPAGVTHRSGPGAKVCGVCHTGKEGHPFARRPKFYRPTTGVRQRKRKEEMFPVKFQELTAKLPLPMYGFL